MRDQLQVGAERFFRFGLYITLWADSLDEMKFVQQKIETILKRNDEIGRLINEMVIEQDCMKVFCEYFNEGFTTEVMRFLYGKKFELILNRLEDKGVDEKCCFNRK